MLRRKLPPPSRITFTDVLQILIGVIAIPLGLVILFRTWQLGGSIPALLIGGAFIAFGLYRTFFAIGRMRWYLQIREANKHD